MMTLNNYIGFVFSLYKVGFPNIYAPAYDFLNLSARCSPAFATKKKPTKYFINSVHWTNVIPPTPNISRSIDVMNNMPVVMNFLPPNCFMSNCIYISPHCYWLFVNNYIIDLKSNVGMSLYLLYWCLYLL